MSSQDGEGFGFAPKDVRRENRAEQPEVVPSAGRTQGPIPRPRPVAQSFEPSTVSGRPAWLWLLIGIFIGAGGTLLSSALWLPDMNGVTVSSLEAKESPLTIEDDEKTEATPSEATPSNEPDVGGDDRLRDIAAVTTNNTGSQLEANGPDESGNSPETGTNLEEQAEVLEEETDVNGTDKRFEMAELVLGDEDEAGETERLSGKTPAVTRPVPESATSSAATDDLSPLVDPLATNVGEPLEPITSDESVDILGEIEAVDAEQPEADVEETAVAALVDAIGSKETRPVDQGANQSPVTSAAIKKRPPLPTARSGSEGAANRLYRVQLAAVDDNAAAKIFWQEVNTRLPGVFSDVEPVFNRRTVAEREFMQIWVGAFDRHADASNYCAWLKAQGQDCFVTRVDNL